VSGAPAQYLNADVEQVVRLYDWETDAVAQFLAAQQVPSNAVETAREARLCGADMLSCDETQLCEILAAPSPLVTTVMQAWRKLRERELASAPKLSTAAKSRIDGMRGGAVNLSEQKLQDIPEQIFDQSKIMSLNLAGVSARPVPSPRGACGPPDEASRAVQ
jgi:hypothetical protein